MMEQLLQRLGYLVYLRRFYIMLSVPEWDKVDEVMSEIDEQLDKMLELQ